MVNGKSASCSASSSSEIEVESLWDGESLRAGESAMLLRFELVPAVDVRNPGERGGGVDMMETIFCVRDRCESRDREDKLVRDFV
jgi:hypothetical protein